MYRVKLGWKLAIPTMRNVHTMYYIYIISCNAHSCGLQVTHTLVIAVVYIQCSSQLRMCLGNYAEDFAR